MLDLPVKLGFRLAAVAAHVPLGARLGDIGTDHALLPIYLVRQGAVLSAIGTDIRPGPLQAGRQNIARHGLTGRIALRQGDGLEPIRRGEADALTIAGIGGRLMLEILNPKREALTGARALILQPQSAAGTLRRVLAGRNWLLTAETLTEESGRVYTVMRWERGMATDGGETQTAANWADGRLFPEVWAEYGPLLPETGGALFHRVLRDEINRLRRTISKMEKNGCQPVVRGRLNNLRSRLNNWEEAEQWLYPSD
jgi:tRNA (adenine22-N1)-methyltransferase